MTPTLRTLNLAAQGRRSKESVGGWFESMALPAQKEVLEALSQILLQAHPRQEEVVEAIQTSGLKSTYTPGVLFTRYAATEAAWRTISLPEDEYVKAFRLMLELFTIADGRRR